MWASCNFELCAVIRKTGNYLVILMLHRFSVDGVRWEMDCETLIVGGGGGGKG